MNLYGEVFAEFYDRHFGHYAENAAPYLLQFSASLPEKARRLPILDLGCGTGRLALRFLETGHSYVGLDLSPHMLVRAENRCWRYVAEHQGRFLHEDISRFYLGGSFGLVLSTYNVLNHLESEEKLRGCFRSVRRCLVEMGWFAFDYHTLNGLKEWATAESANWETEKIQCWGECDGDQHRASMLLRGELEGRMFEEKVVNYSYPLENLMCWLKAEGFSRVEFHRIDELDQPLLDPTNQSRVLVMAG